MKTYLKFLILICFIIVSSYSCNNSKTSLNELAITRGKHYGYYDISSKNLNYLINKHNVQGDKIEIIAEIMPEHADSFGIKIFKGEKVVLLYDNINKNLTITTKRNEFKTKYKIIDDRIFTHILIGNSKLEVLLNNSDSVAITCPIIIKGKNNSISLFEKHRKVTIEHFDIWEISAQEKSDDI